MSRFVLELKAQNILPKQLVFQFKIALRRKLELSQHLEKNSGNQKQAITLASGNMPGGE